MKFTIADCTERINQILNYPSVNYIDISHFFDHAISEINTSMKIGIKPLSYLAKKHSFKINETPNVVLLSAIPSSSASITTVEEKPVEDATSLGFSYCFNTTSNKFCKYNNSVWTEFDKLYALYNNYEVGETFVYEAIVISPTLVVWGKIESTNLTEFNLLDFIPMDWINLFLIPYVCFKFSLRDGGSGALFVEEFTQGFQQLQTSYSVPHFVYVKQHAHLLAYKEDLEQILSGEKEWTLQVPTRAIFDAYKIGNSTVLKPDNFYNGGGWL